MVEQVRIEIIGTANFQSVHAEINKLQASLAKVASQNIGSTFTKNTETQLKNAETSFLRTVNSMQSLRTETVRLSDATDHLTSKLVKGHFSAAQYFDVAEINVKTISKYYPFPEIEYLDTGSVSKGIISDFAANAISDGDR